MADPKSISSTSTIDQLIDTLGRTPYDHFQINDKGKLEAADSTSPWSPPNRAKQAQLALEGICRESTGEEPTPAMKALIKECVTGRDANGPVNRNMEDSMKDLRTMANQQIANRYGQSQNPPLSAARCNDIAACIDAIRTTGTPELAAQANQILGADPTKVVREARQTMDGSGDIRTGKIVAEAMLKRGDMQPADFQNVAGRMVANAAATTTDSNTFLRGNEPISGFTGQYLSSSAGPGHAAMQRAVNTFNTTAGDHQTKAAASVTQLLNNGDLSPDVDDFLGTVAKSAHRGATEAGHPNINPDDLARSACVDALVLRATCPELIRETPNAELRDVVQTNGWIQRCANAGGNLQGNNDLADARQKLTDAIDNAKNNHGVEVGTSVGTAGGLSAGSRRGQIQIGSRRGVN